MRIAIPFLGLAFLASAAVAQTPTQEEAASVRVHSLTIISNDLPEPERLQVAQAFKDCTCPLLEISTRVKVKLGDLGYAQATAEIPHLVGLLDAPPAGPADIAVLVTAGARYRIDGIVIKGAVAFPMEEIVTQVPLSPGGLFNATAIGKGLNNVRKLYEAKSYMHFGVMPTLQFDDAQHTVVVTIDIDEGQPSGKEEAKRGTF